MGRVEEEICGLIEDTVRDYDLRAITCREQELHARISQLEEDMNTLKRVFSFVFSDKP